jgi:hypothetical protein
MLVMGRWARAYRQSTSCECCCCCCCCCGTRCCWYAAVSRLWHAWQDTLSYNQNVLQVNALVINCPSYCACSKLIMLVLGGVWELLLEIGEVIR